MKESRNQESTYTKYFQTSEIYQTDKFLISDCLAISQKSIM